MNEERIALLESVIVDLWHSHVEPFLTPPEFGDRFLKIDRKTRELGLNLRREK